jgi:hypothetical protein
MLGQFGKSNGSLTLTCFVSPWKCKASSLALSWENSNSIFLQESVQTRIFFWQCFLIRLLPSMREAVGAGNKKTAAAIVKAADPCGMLEDATTLWSRPPRQRKVGAQLQQMGRRVTKGGAMPVPKVALLPALTSTRFTTLAMACVSFTTTMPTRLSGVFHHVLGQKTKTPPNPYRFGSNINTRHCHGYAFPGNCRTHFSD